MQKQKFEILQPRELVKCLEDAFSTMPLVPRDCVKALNKFSYNLNHQNFTPEALNTIIFLVLRGFTSKDNYLKSMVYAILQRVSGNTGDGIVALNSIIKDLDDKNIPINLKNSGYRTLFTYLPKTMKNDFIRYIKIPLLDDRTRDNAVCIASEFLKDLTIDKKVLDRIDDYHSAFFNKMPINRYSSMLEIRRMFKSSEEQLSISKYLGSGTDSIIFIEAAKVLAKLRQELAAPHVEKAVSTLRLFLKKESVEQLVAMKILNQLSINFPSKVARANKDIEDLISSTSKTIGMLAILTLLKTGDSETAKQLASKLESLMHIMSEPYKIMAIETIERLSGDNNEEFVIFLKNALFGKGTIEFKRFILKKIEIVLRSNSNRSSILKFLCSYLEDPEFYQISIDILGILGCYLESEKDLVHIYNRIILDNSHVRNGVYQALYDLNERLDTIETLKAVEDPETLRLRSFLISNQNLKKGEFDFNELGDLKDEVLKYLEMPEEEAVETKKPTDSFIKECRSISISPPNSDVKISVLKKIFEDKILLCFSFENTMNKVIINSGLLSFVGNSEKYSLSISKDDFKESIDNVDKRNTLAYKELEIPVEKDAVFNGVFEYQISLQGDFDETEEDEIQLVPFDINILDFIRPVSIKKVPENSRSLELRLKLKPIEAISKIVGTCNMFLITDKDIFECYGVYENEPVVIKGSVSYTKYSTVNLEIFCEDNSLIDEIISVFD